MKKINKNRSEALPDQKSKIRPKFTNQAIARIAELAETLCEAEGMELVHVEFQREAGGRILRVYIDKPGGVGLGDCVHISRQLSDLLDVVFNGEEPAYNLEVTSPGADRPISKASDFERFKGRFVKIKTRLPMNGRKNFSGKLLGISEGMVRLQCNDMILTVAHQEILKARVAESQSFGGKETGCNVDPKNLFPE